MVALVIGILRLVQLVLSRTSHKKYDFNPSVETKLLQCNYEQIEMPTAIVSQKTWIETDVFRWWLYANMDWYPFDGGVIIDCNYVLEGFDDIE